MNDLLKRSIFGFLYVLILVSGIIIHPFVFAAVFLTVMLLTQFEFFKVAKSAGYSVKYVLPLVLGSILFLACFFSANQFFPWQTCLFLFPFIIIILAVHTFLKAENFLQNVTISLLGFLYISIPFSLLSFIVIPGFPTNSTFVPYILLGVFLIIWVYDSFAYLFGSMFGKHKIAPKISANKSWEGVIGGGVFAIIMGMLNAVMFKSESMLSWVVIALIVIVFGTIGDFFESKLKREIGAKDSGTILPGHGGLLDRFDSFLFVIPVVYIWLIFGGQF